MTTKKLAVNDEANRTWAKAERHYDARRAAGERPDPPAWSSDGLLTHVLDYLEVQRKRLRLPYVTTKEEVILALRNEPVPNDDDSILLREWVVGLARDINEPVPEYVTSPR